MQEPRVVMDGTRLYYAFDANQVVDHVRSTRTPAEFRRESVGVELDRIAAEDGRRKPHLRVLD